MNGETSQSYYLPGIMLFQYLKTILKNDGMTP